MAVLYFPYIFSIYKEANKSMLLHMYEHISMYYNLQ